jgi:hypothetical protein
MTPTSFQIVIVVFVGLKLESGDQCPIPRRDCMANLTAKNTPQRVS